MKLRYLSVLTASGLLLLGGCGSSGGGSASVAYKINDTGITTCSDYAQDNSGIYNNDLNCVDVGVSKTADGSDADNDPVPAGQDALYGRDALASQGALGKVGTGDAGFDFTKLDATDGHALAADAPSWGCVRDNVTKLVWEAKTDKDGTQASSLHDADDTYTWYQTSANNGDTGTQNSNTSCSGYLAGDDSTDCNTSAFVERVNTEKLCGFDDWRLPNSDELLSIVNNGNPSPSPAIDSAMFDKTQTSYYWSSTNNATDAAKVWQVRFDYGQPFIGTKSDSQYIRLVRGN